MYNILNSVTRGVCAAALGASLLAAPAVSQAFPQLPPGWTSEDAIRMFQESAEFRALVRDQLQNSGLSPDEMRGLLAAAGYPPSLLDAFLADEASGPEDPRLLAAISALGVDPFAQIEVQPVTGDSVIVEIPDLSDDEPAGLPTFGMNIFVGDGSAFGAIEGGPVPGSYRLGPGDHLVLIITGAVEASQELIVTRQGFVVINGVGQVSVSGLTLDQLRQVLYDRLGARYSTLTRDPNARTRFEVVVSRIRAQTILLVGEVQRPGSYQVSAAGGVLNALFRAGGPTERGSFRNVQVRRGTELLAQIDLYDYLLEGIVPNDVTLGPGDVIFVPIHGPRVKIAGEVMRPAVYELIPEETLDDLVRYAGGLTPYAATENATIDRVLPPDERPAPGYTRRVLSVSLAVGADSTRTPVPLRAADSVTVLGIRGNRRSTVSIGGSVWQPGDYELRPGMRLWDLIPAAGGVRPETYEGRAHILRLRPDSSRLLMAVLLDTSGNPAPRDNPLLQESDEVTIYSRADFRPARRISIEGSVNMPGTIEFSDSMTLRDAVMLAQGLRDDAYLLEAEISRYRPNASSADSMVTILRVPMDSSYVLDPSSYVARPVATATPDVILHPYDRISIRRQPGWGAQQTVMITGEVRFPGAYTLSRPDEQLSSIVDRAGGLTPAAYPNGIRFVRAENGVGRISVDLPQVLAQPGHRDDLALVAGDSIHIPRYLPTVQVTGLVNFPTSVAYVPDADINYYINAAGGGAHAADEGKTFVQQPNGLIRVGAKPEPGSVVVVPQKDPSDRGFLQLIPLFSTMVQVFATTATLIIALRQ